MGLLYCTNCVCVLHTCALINYPPTILFHFIYKVIYVKAVPISTEWEASAVGYLRGDPNIYECPVYSTSFRGPTYIFLATLKTRDPATKWILSGCALLMQTDT